MSRLLTPEELAALLEQGPYVPAPVERLHVAVVAGFTDLTIDEVNALKPGDVIALSGVAGDPVEIVANGFTVGTGTLTDVDGRAAVRVVSRRAPGRTSR